MQLLQDYYEGKLECDSEIQMRSSFNEKKMLIKNVSICLLYITRHKNLIVLSLKKVLESDIYFCANYFSSAVVHCMLQTLQETDSVFAS